MSTVAHLVAGLLTVGSLTFILYSLRRGRLRAKYVMLWLSVGSLMAVMAVSPSMLDRISSAVGISYGPTTLFLAAIVFLLLTSVHFSLELSRTEEQLRTLVEELALLRAELEDRER